MEGKAERLTWHKAWTAVSSGFSISYTSRGVMSHIQRETSCSRPRLNSNLDADLYGY
ncbi:hypothetical protein JN43_005196, partial [Salmonella enterica subsp. enterica serovar Typhimurium]|nr:hypothetical protein [Salmonella enterica subsp. enterica serovar Typhimurium]